MSAKYTSAGQQRLLKVLMALFADVVTGLAPGVIAKTVGASPSAITRDLENLRTAGLATRDEATGAWRLTPRLPQQTVKVWAAINAAQTRLDEAKQRFGTA